MIFCGKRISCIAMYNELKKRAKRDKCSVGQAAYLWVKEFYDIFGYPSEDIKGFLEVMNEDQLVLSFVFKQTGIDEYEKYRSFLIQWAKENPVKIGRHCFSEEEIVKLSPIKVLDIYSSLFYLEYLLDMEQLH